MGLIILGNKFKGSVARLTPVWPFAVFAAAVLACVPLRLYQTIRLIEPETGFFTLGNHVTDTIMYVVAAVAAVLILVLSYLGIGAKTPMPGEGRSGALCAIAAVMAVAFLADGVGTVYSLVRSAVEYSSTLGASGTARYTVMQLVTEGAQILFAVLSCTYFACLSFSWNGRSSASLYAALAVAPVFWAIARAVNRFIRMINFKNVSDLLLELFMLAFMMIFFLAFARVNSKVERTGVQWQVYGCGLVASLLAAIVSIPRLVMLICGLGDRIAQGYPLNLCDLFLPFFIVFYLLVASSRKAEEGPAALKAGPAD